MPPRASLAKHTLQPFVCAQCRLRCTTRVRREARSFSVSTSKSQAKWALLTNRRLIRLSGPDAANFLHNIIPAKILGVGTAPIYTAFLSAQGRILQDVFVYPPSWDGDTKQEWLVEVDAESARDLFKHLKKHKLRSKFAMELVNEQEAGVWYRWPSDVKQATEDWRQDGVRAGGNDSRPGMGTRLVLNQASQQDVRSRMEQETAADATVEDYTVHRMLNGLAEGQKEVSSGHALPQESNIDFLGGIDFHKGCYLGQELTIRTHHTGVVRKRILACQIYDDAHPIPGGQSVPEYKAGTELQLPPSESNISKLSTRKGRSTGKWLGGIGNIGLALCRLEMMTDVQLTADATNYKPEEEYRVQWGDNDDGQPVREVRLKPFVLPWVGQGIEQSLNRKERKPRKRDEEEEDEVD